MWILFQLLRQVTQTSFVFFFHFIFYFFHFGYKVVGEEKLYPTENQQGNKISEERTNIDTIR